MGEVIEKASTQYGDCKGTVSIDWHQGTEIHELAHDHGVPGEYFPVGLEVYRPDMRSLTIYAVHTGEVGKTADEIMAFIRSQERGTPLPVHAFTFEVDPERLDRYIKPFDIFARTHVVGNTPLEIVARQDVEPEA